MSQHHLGWMSPSAMVTSNNSYLLTALTPRILVALVLAPAIILANGLVISTFVRSPRLLTAPANRLLLFLAVSDLFPGIAGVPAAVGMAFNLQGSHQLFSCRVPFGVILACETASLLIVVALALDKVISLAWPLTYGELVTKPALRLFAALAVSIAVISGSIAVATANKHRDSSSSSNATCFSSFRSSHAFARFQQVHLLLVLLPGAATVSCCSLYVYAVASRHARDIRKVQRTVRNKQFSEKRSQAQQQQQQQQQLTSNASNPNLLAHNNPNSSPPINSNSLAPPSPTPLIRRQSSEIATSRSEISSPSLFSANNTNGGRMLLRRYSTASASVCSSRTRARLSYASSLGLTTLSFFVCRMPRSLFFLLSTSPLDNEDLLAQLSCLPFLLGCALDPWIYAYHNLDLKPLMKRQVRRIVGMNGHSGAAGWGGGGRTRNGGFSTWGGGGGASTRGRGIGPLRGDAEANSRGIMSQLRAEQKERMEMEQEQLGNNSSKVQQMALKPINSARSSLRMRRCLKKGGNVSGGGVGGVKSSSFRRRRSKNKKTTVVVAAMPVIVVQSCSSGNNNNNNNDNNNSSMKRRHHQHQKQRKTDGEHLITSSSSSPSNSSSSNENCYNAGVSKRPTVVQLTELKVPIITVWSPDRTVDLDKSDSV